MTLKNLLAVPFNPSEIREVVVVCFEEVEGQQVAAVIVLRGQVAGY